jgi:hypothetical protein
MSRDSGLLTKSTVFVASTACRGSSALLLQRRAIDHLAHQTAEQVVIHRVLIA